MSQSSRTPILGALVLAALLVALATAGFATAHIVAHPHDAEPSARGLIEFHAITHTADATIVGVEFEIPTTGDGHTLFTFRAGVASPGWDIFTERNAHDEVSSFGWENGTLASLQLGLFYAEFVNPATAGEYIWNNTMYFLNGSSSPGTTRVAIVGAAELATAEDLSALNDTVVAQGEELEHLEMETHEHGDGIAATEAEIEALHALITQLSNQLNETTARATSANNSATAALGQSTENADDVESLQAGVASADEKASGAGTLPLMIGVVGLLAGLAGVGAGMAALRKKPEGGAGST